MVVRDLNAPRTYLRENDRDAPPYQSDEAGTHAAFIRDGDPGVGQDVRVGSDTNAGDVPTLLPTVNLNAAGGPTTTQMPVAKPTPQQQQQLEIPDFSREYSQPVNPQEQSALVEDGLRSRVIQLVQPTSLCPSLVRSSPTLTGAISAPMLTVSNFTKSRQAHVLDVAMGADFLRRYWRTVFLLALTVTGATAIFSFVPIVQDAIATAPHSKAIQFSYLPLAFISLLPINLRLVMVFGAEYPYTLPMLVWMTANVGALISFIISEYISGFVAMAAFDALASATAAFAGLWFYSSFKVLQCRIRLTPYIVAAASGSASATMKLGPLETIPQFPALLPAWWWPTRLAKALSHLPPPQQPSELDAQPLNLPNWCIRTALGIGTVTAIGGSLVGYGVDGAHLHTLLSIPIALAGVFAMLLSMRCVSAHVAPQEHVVAVLFALFPSLLANRKKRRECKLELQPDPGIKSNLPGMPGHPFQSDITLPGASVAPGQPQSQHYQFHHPSAAGRYQTFSSSTQAHTSQPQQQQQQQQQQQRKESSSLNLPPTAGATDIASKSTSHGWADYLDVYCYQNQQLVPFPSTGVVPHSVAIYDRMPSVYDEPEGLHRFHFHRASPIRQQAVAGYSPIPDIPESPLLVRSSSKHVSVDKGKRPLRNTPVN
ncbi:hypothetical protein CAOG_00946 [Capsaspora owczarzaki ATCC 30864]|uniref:Uncharacterized protein n=1 Tax=Capsaspora owczarzaki (strain ATCC 30864) TaxID=595528 RepID=A0A0D2X0Q8_CAPO3|nr:hypothetical protein CAOG_00946 [Capsaspora owczarzaki ATCC 30864]KJE89484.1 hypothetical protein CAOG_000946 [Capsaspora owczarzaki ATCC 30864]|eukprot:XP_004365817.2 hypothetical protein CAOG_00946 [Capsaspora owczarzaki ATCC 30864]